jgi:hypothetical protein
MNIGIIDDPAKDYKTASSPVYQEAVIDWYDTTFFTRADPKLNGIIIILTRWHQSDLAGQLLKKRKRAANNGALSVSHGSGKGRNPRTEREEILPA